MPPAKIPKEILDAMKARADSGNSGYNSYYKKLFVRGGLNSAIREEDRFNPTVVQSSDEFRAMIRDMSTRCPLSIRTVHLPKDVHFNDPRLRGKLHPCWDIQTQELEVGKMPDIPPRPFVADLPRIFVSPDWLPRDYEGEEVRFQILPHELIPIAKGAGTKLKGRGRSDRLEQALKPRGHSPKEIADFSAPHGAVSDSIKAKERILAKKFEAKEKKAAKK